MSDNLNVFALTVSSINTILERCIVYLISLSVCVDSTYKQSKRQQAVHLCANVEVMKGHAFVKEILFVCRFSLTLIDTLDTLVVSFFFFCVLEEKWSFSLLIKVIQFDVFFCWQLLNKTTEFETAVRRVLSDVRLDNDIVVSVFETNIRVLG